MFLPRKLEKLFICWRLKVLAVLCCRSLKRLMLSVLLCILALPDCRRLGELRLPVELATAPDMRNEA